MAFALFTIVKLIFVARLFTFTTVAAVISAILVVVAIVADAVTLEFRDIAWGFLVLTVQTLACITVFELFFVAILATAVAAVPATSTAVVVVVTVMIALVFWRTALAITFGPFGFGVAAQALLAVLELGTVPVVAAVAFVVPAFRHVVHIITESVA